MSSIRLYDLEGGGGPGMIAINIFFETLNALRCDWFQKCVCVCVERVESVLTT